MRGNITVKTPGKVYELRVSLGRDPATGKYRQKSLTVRGTRMEAERALRELVEEIEAGRVRGEDPQRTFGMLLDEWLTFLQGLGRSPTTIERYRNTIEHQLKLWLGDVPLLRLRTKAFDDLYRELGHDLQPSTVLKVHVVARAALARAVKWGWIDRNPASDAEPPSQSRRAITTPNRDQLAKLLAAAEVADPMFAVYLRVGAATGARRGELCALRWSDIDLEGARLVIERGIIVVAGGVEERATKTRNRRIGKPLGIVTATALGIRSGLGRLPEGVRRVHVLGASFIAGIGFTVSLFVAGLSFNGMPLDEAKIGILAASITSGTIGVAVLLAASRRVRFRRNNRGRAHGSV